MATKCKRKKKHILARNELKKKSNVRATDNSPSEAKSKTVRIIEVNSSSDSFDDSDIESNASSQASGNCVISLTRNSDRDRESFNEDNSLLWQRQFYYFSTNEFRERNGYEHFPYHFVVYLYFRDISYQGSDFSPTESINFELMVSDRIKPDFVEFCRDALDLNFAETIHASHKGDCSLFKRALKPKKERTELVHLRSEYETLKHNLNITAW